jgi:hypothetical protein
MPIKPRRKSVREKPASYRAKDGKRRRPTLRWPNHPTQAELERYDEEIRRHFGKWVCVEGYQIVAVANSPIEALALARKRGYPNARVKRAPMTPNARILIA